MAWEYVNCAECGNEYRVQMYGPTKTREWKIDNWNGICDDCKEAAKTALVEQNKAGDLPELTGSEKQIAWAMKIRAAFIEYAEKMDTDKVEVKDIILEFNDEHQIVADLALIKAALETVLEKTSSHWWIESRHDLNSDIAIKAMSEIAKSITVDPVEGSLQADVEAEVTMRPTTPVSETVADISRTDNHILISFRERNDDFKKIVKSHGYRWDTPWKKSLSFATESTEDRMAEVGHELLSAGFCIRIMDHEIREKILSESFTQEHTRWIWTLTNKPDHFYIAWKYEDNMYQEAKKIAGARYDRPGITVPMEHVDEVLDFADMYQFKFTPSAKRLIDRAQTNKAAALVVELEAKKKELLAKRDGIPPLDVPVDVEIDDELKD